MTADGALELMFTDPLDDLDSGGELDIEEDPDFPLPSASDSECTSESESDSEDDDDDTNAGNNYYEIVNL